MSDVKKRRPKVTKEILLQKYINLFDENIKCFLLHEEKERYQYKFKVLMYISEKVEIHDVVIDYDYRMNDFDIDSIVKPFTSRKGKVINTSFTI